MSDFKLQLLVKLRNIYQKNQSFFVLVKIFSIVEFSFCISLKCDNICHKGWKIIELLLQVSLKTGITVCSYASAGY